MAVIGETDPNVKKLRDEIEQAKARKHLFDQFGKVLPLTGVVICVTMLLLYFSLEKDPVFLGIGIFYFVIVLIYPVFNLSKSIGLEIEALQSELSLILTGVEAIEQRAERLFKSHEINLRRYYDQALTQSGFIFVVGIVCILIGFCFVGLSFYLLYDEKLADDNYTKTVITILGIASGVLTNFVAIIYLKIYAQTTKSFTNFHEKLVTTNHLHFANFLVSKINDKKILNASLRDISKKITEKL